MTRRRKQALQRFEMLNNFVDLGLSQLTRSEIAVYLILFRDTQPNGLARTSLPDLARRGGMSERQASRALNRLIKRGAIHLIKRGFVGRAAVYSTYPPAVLAEMRPNLKGWLDGKTGTPDDLK